MLLKGKVAIITGSSRGIGAASAKALGKEGAAVVVNYVRNRSAAERVVDEIRAMNGRAIAVQADVTQREEVDRMVAACLESFGQIDILVNSVAYNNIRKKFGTMTWEDYQWQIDGSLKAAFHCCQAVLPSMLQRGAGKIINISSTTFVSPTLGSHAYITAKAAIVGFSRSLALELAPSGIAVNIVQPSFVLTDRTANSPEEARLGFLRSTPLGRLCEPEDVAGAVLFLASDLSSFVAGATVSVTGGRSMA
ncbi:MAG: 3-oxoacyl-ACP reductase FabG [Chloroflexi bacterium]|nr:3-oxoacyl-ACP reductase FabG [Chloroflexota bacterium]